jgi:hypothetical protein
MTANLSSDPWTRDKSVRLGLGVANTSSVLGWIPGFMMKPTGALSMSQQIGQFVPSLIA